MTTDDVRDLLRRAISITGEQKAWADANHISQAYVSDVLARGREPGKKILNALGLERVTTYRRVKP